MRHVIAWSLLVAMSAALAGCAGTPFGGDVYPKPSDFEIHGIDVSKYQGLVDWEAVRGDGVQFAWIKATEGGDYADEQFARNWEMAREAGIPRGAYHFQYWCRPASQQIAWFESHVPVDPQALPPVLDLEWNGASKTCPKKVPRDVAIAEVRTMLEGMERAYGKRPVIYTSVDFHADVLKGNFDEYPMWVRSVKYYPTVKYGSRRWHFWQHTAEGHVPGIKGFVDRNAFYGTAEQWKNWLTKGGAS